MLEQWLVLEEEGSIGVQFLFASQKDDREREKRRIVRMLEQWLGFGR